MVELEIQDALWDEFVAIAQRQRTHPQALAEQVLREFVQRVSDEELLACSEGAARRAGFPMEQAEEKGASISAPQPGVAAWDACPSRLIFMGSPSLRRVIL
jgi:hypothetical protein